MKQGRFQAGRREKPEEERSRRRFDWLLIAIPTLVLGALAAILFVTLGNRGQSEGNEAVGFSKEETIEQYRNLAAVIERSDMVLTLLPDDPEATDDPIVMTIPPDVSCVRVDLNGLTEDINKPAKEEKETPENK